MTVQKNWWWTIYWVHSNTLAFVMERMKQKRACIFYVVLERAFPKIWNVDNMHFRHNNLTTGFQCHYSCLFISHLVLYEHFFSMELKYLFLARPTFLKGPSSSLSSHFSYFALTFRVLTCCVTDVLCSVLDEAPQSRQSSTNWLSQLYEELEKQGINLPERWFNSATLLRKERTP